MNPESQKILSLVKEAISLSKEEDDLNKILANLSKKAELNPEEINRVVELTNTLKQLSLFKTSEDKTSEFNMADSKEIKNLIYGEKPLEKISRDEYSLEETFYKKASYTPKVKGTYSDYKVDRNTLVKKAYENRDKLSNILEETLVSKHHAQDTYYSSLLKLAENLDKHSSELFSEFEIDAQNTFGSEITPYIDALEKLAKVNNKRALKISSKNVIKTSDNISLLKTAMVNRQLYLSMSSAEKNIKGVKTSWDRKIREYGLGTT